MRERPRIWLMLLPAMSVIFLLFMGGVLLGLVQSLNYMPLIGNHTPNLDAYIAILSSKQFLTSLGFTIYIAVASTLISIVIAIIAALVLRKTFVGKKLSVFLFQFTLPIPHIVGAVALIMLLAQGGFFSRLLFLSGIVSTPSDFPQLVYDYNGFGIILAYVWKEIPFIGVAILAILQSTAPAYEEQARSLGANAWQRFRHVLLPLMFPSILATSILVFAFVFGTFEIPYLIGASWPVPLPVLAYENYTDIDLNMRSQAMAMAMIITVIITILIMLYAKITRTYIRQESGD